MDPRRSQRISEALREELAEIIAYEMADPRLDAVDVLEVVIGAGMRHAKVLVQLRGDELECTEALKALEGARGYLRRELAARIRLFRIPELHFEAGACLERVLSQDPSGFPSLSEKSRKAP
jgi:ribosome-binding factor A